AAQEQPCYLIRGNVYIRIRYGQECDGDWGAAEGRPLPRLRCRTGPIPRARLRRRALPLLRPSSPQLRLRGLISSTVLRLFFETFSLNVIYFAVWSVLWLVDG